MHDVHGQMKKSIQKPVFSGIVDHYEECLSKHGDSHLGVDWPSEQGAVLRQDVMLGLIRDTSKACTLLDFGCGLAHLYEHIQDKGLRAISYSGLDASEKFIQRSKQKYPSVSFYHEDILSDPDVIGSFDYIIANGVFTERCDLSNDKMWRYFRELVSILYEKANIGVAFNLMSKHVDWEREDLFHVSYDQLGEFLTSMSGRNYVIRSDYGMYEYTVYVYKQRKQYC